MRKRPMRSIRPTAATVVAAIALAACASTRPEVAIPSGLERMGVLVMAHGGTDEWNAAVAEAVAPLRADVPTSVAFGMADPVTLGSALRELEAQGVGRVAVVRLFLSGSSFRHQAEYLLGLRPDRPRWFVSHGDHASADPTPIEHGMRVATHADGLSDAPGVARIVADRVDAVGVRPVDESVVLLAHGVGDDRENDALLERMREATGLIADRPYRRIHVATLREDWPDKRDRAEADLRAVVASESRAGARVLVVPFRLFGVGPYREVLEGLTFTMTDGLVPHAEVTGWLRATATRIACAEGWEGAPEPCPTAATPD